MVGERAHRLTIRAALLLGFSLTLGLWIVAGYDVAAHLTSVQAESAALAARYMRAQELLSTVRVQVLLSSVYVRDALLDPDPAAIDAYRQRLQDSYSTIDDALTKYVPVFDSDNEQARVADFRRELITLRDTVREVLAVDRSQWPIEARRLLNERVLPKRESIIRLSEDVQTLNRRTFIQQQATVAAVQLAGERVAWWRLGLALAASLAVAVLATLYAGWLENHLQAQRALHAHNADDLRRLSAQLVNAQEAERRTIARELHDEVGQVLTAVKVELSRAQGTIERAGVPSSILDSAQTITNGALQSVRDLSRLLHPAVLDDLGLLAAVETHLNHVSDRHGLAVELRHESMRERLAPEVEVTVYRIIQEALTNVVRHAGATRCRVTIRRHADALTVTIEDDGRGFHAAGDVADQTQGLGLLGIRERAMQLRGSMHVESAPGHGTKLIVDLPVAAGTTGRGGEREWSPAAAKVTHG